MLHTIEAHNAKICAHIGLTDWVRTLEVQSYDLEQVWSEIHFRAYNMHGRQQIL